MGPILVGKAKAVVGGVLKIKSIFFVEHLWWLLLARIIKYDLLLRIL